MTFRSSSFSSSTSSSIGVSASLMGGNSVVFVKRFIHGAKKLVMADTPKNAPAIIAYILQKRSNLQYILSEYKSLGHTVRRNLMEVTVKVLYSAAQPHFVAVVVPASQERRIGQPQVQGLPYVAIGVNAGPGCFEGTQSWPVPLSSTCFPNSVKKGHRTIFGEALHMSGESGLRCISGQIASIVEFRIVFFIILLVLLFVFLFVFLVLFLLCTVLLFLFLLHVLDLPRLFLFVVLQFRRAASAGGTTGAAVFWDLHFGDGRQSRHCRHRRQRCSRHQLIQVEAGMHSRIDVDRHFQALFHTAIWQLHHEVRPAYGASFHLETLLFCHSLEQRLHAWAFRCSPHVTPVVSDGHTVFCTYCTVEDETGKDEVGPPPSEVLQQHDGQWSEGESSEPRATHGDACRERSLRFEIVANADHGRQIDQPKADP
ncbi:hypothetical protein C0J52_24733 [Blattella germanica]|nr:hypothetical protein C0J52_24733 [Blattella germanica]